MEYNYLSATKFAVSHIHTVMDVELKIIISKLALKKLRNKQWWTMEKPAGNVSCSSLIPRLICIKRTKLESSQDTVNSFGEYYAKKWTLGGRDSQHGVFRTVKPRSKDTLSYVCSVSKILFST